MNRNSMGRCPWRLCSWFGTCLFVATAPLGCGGCAVVGASVQAQGLLPFDPSTTVPVRKRLEPLTASQVTSSQVTSTSASVQLRQSMARAFACNDSHSGTHCSKKLMVERTFCKATLRTFDDEAKP